MKITQKVIKDQWFITISFESFTYTNGNGPFFLTGDFNNWKVEDQNYKIKPSYNGGSNTLNDFTLAIPSSTKSFEFKIYSLNYNGKKDFWINPEITNSIYSIYYGYKHIVKNPYGTYNAKVFHAINEVN